MAVPELALGSIEGLVKGGTDHVFDADESGVLVGGVVDETLADVCDREVRMENVELGFF